MWYQTVRLNSKDRYTSSHVQCTLYSYKYVPITLFLCFVYSILFYYFFLNFLYISEHHLHFSQFDSFADRLILNTQAQAGSSTCACANKHTYTLTRMMNALALCICIGNNIAYVRAVFFFMLAVCCVLFLFDLSLHSNIPPLNWRQEEENIWCNCDRCALAMSKWQKHITVFE